MREKAMNQKLQRRPIPDEKLAIITDQTVYILERVRIAEACRNEYGWSQNDMAKLTKISVNAYLRYVKKLSEPRKYRHPARLSGEDVETIYQTGDFALYRRQHNVYLAAAVRCKTKENIYLLSPYTPVIKAVVKVLGLIDTAGYRMTSTLEITAPNGELHGTLMHHIAAGFFSIRLDFLIGKRVRFRKRKNADGIYDYRLCNVWFPGMEYLSPYQPVHIDRLRRGING